MIAKLKDWLRIRKERSEVVAVVVLQTAPRLFTKSSLEQLLSQAGIQTNFVEERTSYLRATIDGFEITVASTPSPYAPMRRAKPGEQRLKEACQTHEACILIDTWKAPEGVSRRDSRPLLAQIAAALTDSSVMAYYDWTTSRLCLPDPEIIELLEAGKLDEAVGQMGDGVIDISSQDKRVLDATAEARSRWHEFVNEFAKGERDAMFIAKIRFEEGEYSEHMWVEVQECDLETIKGVVSNKPFKLVRPQKGDVVSVSTKDLSDWMMATESGTVGGFVEEILRRGK